MSYSPPPVGNAPVRGTVGFASDVGTFNTNVKTALDGLSGRSLITQSDLSGTVRIHDMKFHTDTTDYSTTSTTRVNATLLRNPVESRINTPQNPNCRLLVTATVYSIISDRVEMEIIKFDGAQYNSIGAKQRSLASASSSGNSTAATLTLQADLSYSDRRFDTGVWLPRIGYNSFSGGEVSVIYASVQLTQYEVLA